MHNPGVTLSSFQLFKISLTSFIMKLKGRNSRSVKLIIKLIPFFRPKFSIRLCQQSFTIHIGEFPIWKLKFDLQLQIAQLINMHFQSDF